MSELYFVENDELIRWVCQYNANLLVLVDQLKMHCALKWLLEKHIENTFWAEKQYLATLI